MTDENRDATRLELACVRTWVNEEDTRESVREATRFPQDGEAMTEPDVPEKEVDIRTVTVTPADGGGGLGEALGRPSLMKGRYGQYWRQWYTLQIYCL